MISRRHLFWLMLAGGFSLQQTVAFAEDGGSDGVDGDNDDDDQNRALDAVQNDKAASLKEILAIVREKYEGEVVDVSLQGSGADLTYTIKLLDEQGRLIEIQVNAQSRKITGTKGI